MLHLNYSSLKGSSGLLSPATCAEVPSRGLHRATATMRKGEAGTGNGRQSLFSITWKGGQSKRKVLWELAQRERESYVVTESYVVMLCCPNMLIQSSGLSPGNTTFRYWLLHTVGFCWDISHTEPRKIPQVYIIFCFWCVQKQNNNIHCFLSGGWQTIQS